jgi:hypothetical protein
MWWKYYVLIYENGKMTPGIEAGIKEYEKHF